jgi:hypothetical protein
MRIFQPPFDLLGAHLQRFRGIGNIAVAQFDSLADDLVSYFPERGPPGKGANDSFPFKHFL